jgi:hypothetical protein
MRVEANNIAASVRGCVDFLLTRQLQASFNRTGKTDTRKPNAPTKEAFDKVLIGLLTG